MLCFAGMHKSLMHNSKIRVTAGKYQDKVSSVANYCGTLAEMEGGFGCVTKSSAGSLLLFFHMQPNGMQLDQIDRKSVV